jgi:hypothetical protein
MNQAECEAQGGEWFGPSGDCNMEGDPNVGGTNDTTDEGDSTLEGGTFNNDWQFEGLDLDDIEHTPTTWETGSSWNVTDEFLAQDGIHTFNSEEILAWLGQEGFGDDITQAQSDYMQTFGDIGEHLAFDQSQIDELGIGFAMQEDAMVSEYAAWEEGAHAMLFGEGWNASMGSDAIGGAIGNMKALAQQELDAFELANTERRSQEKKATADLRRSALQGLATTRRASARSGISSGMGSTKGLDSFVSKSREQSVGSRAAQKDYLASVTSIETQRNFNVQSAIDTFTNEQSAKRLANENAMTQMNYDFAAQASSAYDDWYSSLVGMAGAYFQTAASDGENFDLFGTGG